MRPTKSSSSKWWWWWPASVDSAQAHSSDQSSNTERVRLVVVHAGGTVLRASSSLSSPKVGVLRRGEVVTLLKEETDSGRVCVRTREGVKAWISTFTSDNIPIVRRVTASTSFKSQDMPLEGTSSFADAFEARWQEKWQRLRVDADRQEATPRPLRISSLGIPLRAWRPSGKPNFGKKATLRTLIRRRPAAPKPVPKLEQPASSRASIVKFAKEETPLPVQMEELPDLIGFDTWPGTGRESSNDVPSLVELLGGRLGRTQLKSSQAFDDPVDELPNQAVVFNTEPVKSSQPMVAEVPPTRGFSIDVVESKQEDIGSFEYLLQDIVAETDQDVENLDTVQEADAQDERTLLIDQPQEGDDQTAVEALLGLTNFPEVENDKETDDLPGFQFDPLPRAWAKRSNMKVNSRFPRYAKPELQSDLQTGFDFENFNDLDESQLETEVTEVNPSPEHILEKEISDIKNDLDALVDQNVQESLNSNYSVADVIFAGSIGPDDSPKEEQPEEIQEPSLDEIAFGSIAEKTDTPPSINEPVGSFTSINKKHQLEVDAATNAESLIVQAHPGDIPDLSLDPFFDTSQHQNKCIEPVSAPILSSHEDLLDLSDEPLLDIGQQHIEDLV